MRIAEIISDTNVGGAGVLLLNRLACTDLEKYSVCVCLPKGSALAARLEALGAEYTEIACAGDRSFELGAIPKYVRTIKKLAPDIVNVHGCLSARIAAKICGVPVKICTRHCFYPIKYRNSLVKLVVCGLNSALSDCFIAVAHSARDNLRSLGVRPDKIRVIINGARELERYSRQERAEIRGSLGISEDTFVLIICARLEPCKGHGHFLKIVNRLRHENKNVKALIVGGGGLENTLKKQAEEYGLADSVIFTGFVDDVTPYMNIAQLNVNCSIGTETSSLALSEGMSLGLPAVVNDYGGNSYMVKHGVNGFVCDCRNAEEAASYISLLMNDKELYARTSRAARERFENELNARIMTEKTNLLYDGLYKSVTEQSLKA